MRPTDANVDDYESAFVSFGIIPNPVDQNPCAHWRNPMDMMHQGCDKNQMPLDARRIVLFESLSLGVLPNYPSEIRNNLAVAALFEIHQQKTPAHLPGPCLHQKLIDQAAIAAFCFCRR